MTLTDLVPTLEVCQQLKAAGFPQDTALRWSMQHEPHIPDVEPTWMPIAFNEPILCAAPTAEELEDWLRTKYPDATISSFRRGELGVDVDIDDDILNYHNGVMMYPTFVAALAALLLEVAG